MTRPLDSPGTERARCLRAPNPGVFTLTGTNTWLLSEPESGEVAVVDPGPDLPEHRRDLLRLVAARDQRITQILLTHGHPDHAAGAADLAAATGANVAALDPHHVLGSVGLTAGTTIEFGGLEIRVIATPGHTSDSVSFLLPADGALLTGDTVLGFGTSVVAHPDGRLVDYLVSLQRLQDVVATDRVTTILPGHGPQVTTAVGELLAGYVAHRMARLDQVRAALTGGATTAAEVVQLVYTDVDPSLWAAAEWSVEAQLHYLHEQGVG